MSYVSRFLKGKWLAKAGKYAFNPRKMTELRVQLGKYVSKNGLASVKDTLILMKDYLYDVTTGRYKGYEVKKLIVIVGAIIYVVTPFDFLPDFIPPGLIDDISIVAWALKEASDELEKYKKSKELPPEEA